MYTLADLVDHLVVYCGRDNTRATIETVAASARQACAVLSNKHSWNYFRSAVTIPLTGDYETGTIEINATTRQVTLTGGTWPTWAPYAVLRVDQVDYEVESRQSDSVITLTANSCPTDNVAAGETYTLNRYAYPLPADFEASQYAVEQPGRFSLTHMRTFVSAAIWRDNGSANVYAIMPDRTLPGRYCVWFSLASTSRSLQVSYKRRLPLLRYDQFADDKNSTVAVASTAVTGTNTRFASDMVGQVLRISKNGQDLPSGENGNNLYVHESLIDAVASESGATLRTAISTAVTGRKWMVSSILDVAPGAMFNYMLREAELQTRLRLRMTPYHSEELRAYSMALDEAKDQDSRFEAVSVVDYPEGSYSPSVTVSNSVVG